MLKPRNRRALSKVASTALLLVALTSCGIGNSDSSGCAPSTRENPLIGGVVCKNWDLRIFTAELVPDDLILKANPYNDVSSSKSWIMVVADLGYKGEGTGSIGRAVAPMRSFIVGSKSKTYKVWDEEPTISDLEDRFPSKIFGSSDPYSGGTVTVAIWFWVDSDDSDFVFGLFVDSSADEPNVWVKI